MSSFKQTEGNWNTRKLKRFKKVSQQKSLTMLTCYDFQMAQTLAQTSIDMLLVGDSLGNVVLGLENTISVTLDHMVLFAQAVKRGAPNKFIIVDMPFGTYRTPEIAMENAVKVFQATGCQAIKLEGAHVQILESVKRLKEIGIPVIGHIGLTPQSVHEMGGYFTHGKNKESAERLIQEAKSLEEAGVFALVLECVWPEVATEITKAVEIPTIGIGSGENTDGQVLVTNDLLGMGQFPAPGFVTPAANFFEIKKSLIQDYLNQWQAPTSPQEEIIL